MSKSVDLYFLKQINEFYSKIPHRVKLYLIKSFLFKSIEVNKDTFNSVKLFEIVYISTKPFDLRLD